MVELKIDRNDEYKEFLKEQLQREGLQLSYPWLSDPWSRGPEIKTRGIFGKTVAYINFEPDLSPREYFAKPKNLEIYVMDSTYKSPITRIAEAVEKNFGVGSIVTCKN
jgi:hypothetical protein